MMKKKLLIMCVLSAVFMTNLSMAITLTFDGNLTEWTGDEINNLGTEAAPEGGTYKLLATWDGNDLLIGMDRNSSDRYLGDSYWNNDSFFIAIDVDKVAGSGADIDGYSRMRFNGPMKPDVFYYYAGGSPWYERGWWDDVFGEMNWLGWTDANSFYGYQEANPNDELLIPLANVVGDPSVLLTDNVTGSSEVTVWAWMTREGNGWIEASWPRGAKGPDPNIFGSPLVVRDLTARLFMPHDQSPALYEENVDGDAPITLSWQVAQLSGGGIDASVASYKVYLSAALPLDINTIADPCLTLVATVPKASWSGTLASATVGSAFISKDSRYVWRVDTVKTDTSEVTGDNWTFYTEFTIPVITGITQYQIVAPASTAQFVIDVTSPSVPSYQWKKYVDGVSDINLVNSGDISGADTNTLSIANAEVADEGLYYCVVNNDSGIPAVSGNVPLGVKRLLAHWDFESGNADSIVAGSPPSTLVGDPAFAAGGGISGDGMTFDDDFGNEDLLYVDPNTPYANYFDICNYEMTVACWVKTSNTKTWVPLVARSGEDNHGWQLRQSGFTADRPCFTTRGTGNDDGTPANRTIYDGQWHYVVGTYDGNIKKVYIDGVVSRYYSTDDGSLSNEGDAVSGAIDSTISPVAIAGRVKKDDTDPNLVIEISNNCPGTYDEVKIYNYALDSTAIAQAYATMTSTEVCEGIQPYDLNNDCKIDFNEIALVAGQWLSDALVKP